MARLPYSEYLYLPTTSSDWSVFEEILKPVCSQQGTTPDQLRDVLERIAEVYTRRDRAARFYKDLPRMLWKLPVKERAAFLGTAVPEMARRVIEVEAVMGIKTVGLLRKRRGGGEEHSVSFTPYQASALLSLAFFGVPMYWSDDGCSGRGRPSVRFNFAKFYHDRHNQVAKLRCIVLYFNRQCGATGTSDDRRITITRVRGTHGRMGEWWSTRDVPMSKLEVHGDGERIEDAVGLLQADFANCRVGGGVLSSGCVQEEIRFMICPELLLSTLVGAVDPLADYEAMYIHGAIQFTDYVGYGSSFECSGYVEGVEPQQPSWVIVMDALHFGQHSAHQATQYAPRHVLRELNKCHIALTAPGLPDGVAFATGNWGCGVFGGDPQLKSILQWLACSTAGRDISYFPYDDSRVAELSRVAAAVELKGWTVGDLAAKVLLWSLTESSRTGLFRHLLNEDPSSPGEATAVTSSSVDTAGHSPFEKRPRVTDYEVDKSECNLVPPYSNEVS
ncbi:hypothetical protein FOZ60_002979 [Perkinsus olseni]|uniref:poly(ADP-ribose) glycohydrolase n=2 Tax=Perkinsus olseni TaxID=32597 RepID=A0A7J6NXF1_PEROL|nr:hypothetical protein FOZ60_002979 [Perkinsus olseni]